jgi:hypothetical protein
MAALQRASVGLYDGGELPADLGWRP